MDFQKHMFQNSNTLLFEVLEGIMSVLFHNVLQCANFHQLFAPKSVYKRTKVVQSGASVT